jgi:polysaccharide export outer membrane protein
MARSSRGLLRAGWLVLSLGMACAAGCVTIQVGGNTTEPTPTAMRAQPVEPTGIQPVNYPVPMPSGAMPTPPIPTMAAPPLAPGPTGAPPTTNGGFPGPVVGGPFATHAPAVLGAAPNAPLFGPPPTELNMKSLPPYRVEPPDILVLDTIRLLPKGPFTVGPLDQLLIRVAEPLPNQPIDGVYTVSPEGVINLGYSYGAVRVGGMTLAQVEQAIRTQLAKILERPQVAVGLSQYRGVQQVRGTHLVRPDGTLNLGSYGCVYVAGMCLNEIKVAVERHLAQFADDPEITVDVMGYNSKVIYIIADGGGYGQQVLRLPVTGKDTVLDAIAQVQGLSQVASKKHIWVARPAPAHHGCLQILPVDWRAITEGGATTTNYQLFPGDRVYVGADPLIKADNMLAKVLAPIERILGVTLLTSAVIQNFRNNGNNNGGGTGFIIR